MAGRRHHIIPRFLQKGFASRTEKDEVFVWVFRKNKKPFESNTKNVIVENDFYGKDNEEVNADEVITQVESEFCSPLVNKLRELEGDVSSLGNEISELISHIGIRTKQLRNSFLETINYLTDELDNYMSDFDKVKRLFVNNPSLVKGEFEKVLDTIEAPKELKDSLFPLIADLLPNLLDDEKENFEKMSSELFQNLKPIFPEAAKTGHNKSLTKQPVPVNRAKTFENFKWYICKLESPIILGDIGCFFEVTGKRRFVPLDDLDSQTINVFLPITSEKILIGTKYSTIPKIKIDEINKIIARCSYELFISSETSEKYVGLAKLIGTWTGIFSEKDKARAWKSIEKDIEKINSLTEKNE